jgi:hypothetical protein
MANSWGLPWPVLPLMFQNTMYMLGSYGVSALFTDGEA